MIGVLLFHNWFPQMIKRYTVEINPVTHAISYILAGGGLVLLGMFMGMAI